MPETYPAILKGDRLEWTGESPGPDLQGRVVAVEVAIVGDVQAGPSDVDDRRRRMIEAMERLARRGTFAEIEDSVAWQAEVRTRDTKDFAWVEGLTVIDPTKKS